MRTELTEIQKLLNMYFNPRNEQEFTKAMNALLKVHSKYGTIDINQIKQLIK